MRSNGGRQLWANQTLLALLSIAILAFAIGIGALLVLSIGKNPLDAYGTILSSTFGDANRTFYTLSQSAPLILVSLGLLIAIKGGFWNIGGEGQMFFGAMLGLIIVSSMNFSNAPIMLAVAYAGAFLGGGSWAMISGILKVRYDVDEIVSTLLMNFIAFLFVFYLIRAPFRSPGARTAAVLVSVQMPEAGQTPTYFGMNMVLPIAIAATIIVYFVFKSTKFGFRVKVLGDNKLTALASYGIRRTNLMIVLVSFLSGGIVGVGGMAVLSGFTHDIVGGSTSGTYAAGGFTNSYGFIGLAVVLLAELNPLAVVPASIFFVSLVIGGLSLLIHMAIPTTFGIIITGLAILFISARPEIITRLRRRVSE